MARGFSEPASHRRAWRLRTRARFLLRSWLAGHKKVEDATLQKATKLLGGHHSASTLPAAVLRKQAGMAMQNGSWWCHACKKHMKQTAVYCSGCGKHWQKACAEVPYSPQQPSVPWKSTWTEEPWTPRRHQSPRKRGKNNGKGKGADAREGKGPGVGKGAGKAERTPAPPSLEGLPAAPVAPLVAAPKKPGGEQTPSPEKAQLEALVGVLAASSASLPPAAQQMLASLQETQTQSNTKLMHRAVADQSRARQALAKIQVQRATYLQAWHEYLAQLAGLLETQIQEQSQVLEDLDQSELQWLGADQAATQQLARLTGAPEKEEDGADSMEDTASAVDTAVAAESKLRAATAESQQSAKRMLTALGELRHSAEGQLQQAKRDGSRTPRRGEKYEAPGDTGKPEAPEKKEEAQTTSSEDAAAKTGPGAKQPFQFGVSPPA